MAEINNEKPQPNSDKTTEAIVDCLNIAMMGRRRRGLQKELEQDSCFESEEMPQRQNQDKAHRDSNRRKSWLPYFALVSTFALVIFQVSTLDRSESAGTVSVRHSQSRNSSPASPKNDPLEQRRHLREVASSETASPFPKILVGIFTTLEDSSKDWHRQNLSQQYPNQICALGDYESNKLSSSEKDACQVIYTFVIGGNDDPDAPTELLTLPGDDSKKTPKKHHSLLVKSSGKSLPKDVHENDCTLLDIRENEHDGKSQTFFFFASLLLKEQEEQANTNGSASGTIDYVMKVDAQTKVNWADFFEFVADQLAPAPYNTNTIGGALRDKSMWWGDFEATDEMFRREHGYNPPPTKVKQRKLNKPANKPHPSQMDRLESFWGNEFGGVHLYVDGQLYFMSSDLCHFVANEALYAKSRIGFGGYLEGMEDHDISGMVWHAPSPIHMVPLTKSQRFWEYPMGPE